MDDSHRQPVSTNKQTNTNMVSLRPLPAFINETVGADRGLICGFQLAAGERPREIAVDDMVESLARRDAVTWLHFNLSEARAPERVDLNKFLHRDAAALAEGDVEALQSEADSLGFAIEEVAELYERAKLLQEELASRLTENTGRNLYVLSILTAVLLPMTLVTGIFGMNVAGLPGMESPGSFWRVMLLVVASGVATLLGLLWRRLL